jgi:hypothetical protein
MTIKDIEEKGMIAYKYLRGSWSHGIGVIGKSDYDYGGVFIAPKDMIIGFRDNYVEQVSDEKNDETYYEFGRWLELIRKQNPMALESLFVDKKYIIGNVHPAVQNILDHRYDFLSKECFKPLLSYSYTQIKKATGYNKKCHISEDFQRKDVLDFCYTFKNQGSQPIKEFLAENHLDQRYCGVVNIPNMKDTYGVYYDFAAYFKFEGIDSALDRHSILKNWYHGGDYEYILHKIEYRIDNKEFFHYSGIVYPEDIEKSNEIRLSSIPKGERPICFMTYNKDAYTCHCREYKEWVEWKEKRNPVRYSDNKGYNFDAKNMCETVRLIHTGIELARDGVFNVERTWDREFLLDIKNHEVSYEELMKYVEEKKNEFDELVKKSALPDTVDSEKINNLLISTRNELYF